MLKESLSLRPDRSRSIERLKLDSHEILNLSVAGRYNHIVNVAARNADLRKQVQIVTGLIECQQVKAVGKNLLPFQKAKRANNYI